jgi:hypothetical protein
MIFRKPIVASFLGLFFVTVAHGATDSFTVSLTVTDDSTPPSTPTGLTATPISTSQINLAWSTSTDNVAVTGYQVFRDSVFIATTTSANYSDTSLSPATLYTYFVRAFDAALNISTSSDSVSTTTLAAAAPADDDTASGGGGAILPRLVYLEVVPTSDSAFIIWRTADYARTTLRYGETPSYEMGSLIGQFFKIEHQTLLINLKPDTRYHFMIEGENRYGREAMLATRSFRTLPPVDTFPPGNVRNLKAVRDGQDDILLTWDNPADRDFSRVRLMGSSKFYPSDFADGELVYEGSGERSLDIGKAIPNTVRFYTIFAYDALGNISSGAIVAIKIDANGVVHLYDTDDIPLASDEFIIPLSLDDLIFEQDGKVLEYVQDAVFIDGSKPLNISLPYGILPEHLKSIVMTLRNQSGEKFSFLLRVNEDRSRYTASVAPLGVSGEFPFTASVFDFSVRKVAEIKGAVISEINDLPASTWMDFFRSLGYLPYFILLLILLFGIGLHLIKRGRTRVAV